MADGRCDYGAGNDAVELEAMRGFSWHPCRVSLCSRGLGLIVQYGSNYLEEMIVDTEEIFARIRVRSTPLQGDDCSSIRQGEHVLATKISHAKGVFYDARVEEAIHVRHSKRIHCRCSFRIKWLHRALEEKSLTVPASAIMKLATKSIHLHPVISTFFRMLESSNALDTMPCSMIVDRMNSEMDINVLLEKQIKEISNSTDISQEIISEGFVFRQKVEFKGQSHGQMIDASLKDTHVTIPLLNMLKGSNGSENKQPMETIAKTPPVSIPSIEEEFTGSRLLLSPLAARAALASLRSEFPTSPELLAQSNVEEGDITGEYSNAKVLYENKCCSFSAVDRSSNTEDISLKISATLGGKSPNLESIVKTLFPESCAPQIVDFSNMSSGAQMNGKDEKKKIGEKQITQPSESRVTHAKIRSTNGVHETTEMTKTNETQLMLTKTRRVTRSTVEGADKTEVKEYSAAAEDIVHSECTKLDTSPNTVADVDSSMCSDKDGKSLLGKDGVAVKVDVLKGTFIQNAEKQNYPKRLTRSAAREETEKNHAQLDIQKGTFIQNVEKQDYPKRLTRSAAREEAENNNVQPKPKLRRSSSVESNKVDLLKGNVSSKSNRLELEDSLAPPHGTRVSEQRTDEGEEKRTKLNHVKSTPKSSESGAGSHQGTRQKSAGSRKQETRFSPRLRFLPRTRSQNKA